MKWPAPSAGRPPPSPVEYPSCSGPPRPRPSVRGASWARTLTWGRRRIWREGMVLPRARGDPWSEPSWLTTSLAGKPPQSYPSTVLQVGKSENLAFQIWLRQACLSWRVKVRDSALKISNLKLGSWCNWTPLSFTPSATTLSNRDENLKFLFNSVITVHSALKTTPVKLSRKFAICCLFISSKPLSWSTVVMQNSSYTDASDAAGRSDD